jgi:methyl-accepting chemotaxis protein PixJ
MVDQITPDRLRSQTTVDLAPSFPSKSLPDWAKPWNLRRKVTSIALVLGTLPVVGVGLNSYRIAEDAITQQVIGNQEAAAERLSESFNRIMTQRLTDIQAIASLNILADAKIRDTITAADKEAALNRISDTTYTLYSNIILMDVQGNVLIQTERQNVPNQGGQDYFRQAVKSDKPILSRPTDGQKTVLYFIAPVKDLVTGQTIAIVRADLPLEKLSAEVKAQAANQDYQILDSANQVLLASNPERVGQAGLKDFPEFSEAQSRREASSRTLHDQLVTYAPGTRIEGRPDLSWQILLSNPAKEAFKPRAQLLNALLLGTGVAVVLIGLLAALLADRFAKRITSVSEAVQSLGQGDLNTRLTIAGDDEIASLGTSVNQMAVQLQTLLQTRTQATKELKRFNEATFNLRRSLDFNTILQTGVDETRRLLDCDRALVYLFDDNWQGTIVAESVGLGFPAALGANIADPCFAERFVDRYRQGRVHSIADINATEIDPCYRGQLEAFQVKANIVAPMLVEGKLLGLLVAHQCSVPRQWSTEEVDLLYQMAVHLGYALGQVLLSDQRKKAEQAEALAEERRQQKETIQTQLVELLNYVEKAAMGDLTVRASVGVGEIGTVADFFNAIVENLQHLVQQVKYATVQVNDSLTMHDAAVRSLSGEARLQAEETSATLQSVEQMILSIEAIAQNAQQAAAVSQTASQTAEAGGIAMDQTVESILNLRHTIAETAKKVKRLGESSQQISKVVSLINQIAMQTNLLAINAGIEAARAGEESQGFAAVAEEVGALAARAAEATEEIEALVATIQRETSDVVLAMEQGTSQVVEGTQLVENAKQSLEDIVSVSHQIDQIVQFISTATESQVETSQTITKLMEAIAQVSVRTSHSSIEVSDSLRQTVGIAQELQASVETFKVN